MTNPIETQGSREDLTTIVETAKYSLQKATYHPLIPLSITKRLDPMFTRIVLLSQAEIANHLVAISDYPMVGDMENKIRDRSKKVIGHYTDVGQLHGPRIELVKKPLEQSPDTIFVSHVLAEEMAHALHGGSRTVPLTKIADRDPVTLAAKSQDEVVAVINEFRNKYGMTTDVTAQDILIREKGFFAKFATDDYSYPVFPFRDATEELRTSVIQAAFSALMLGMQSRPSSQPEQQLLHGYQILTETTDTTFLYNYLFALPVLKEYLSRGGYKKGLQNMFDDLTQHFLTDFVYRNTKTGIVFLEQAKAMLYTHPVYQRDIHEDIN